MSSTVNLTADFHGHVQTFVSDVDRAWFAAHPHADTYRRPPLGHEFCIPDGDGGCSQPFAGQVVRVVVHQLAPGVRVRRPIVQAVRS